MSESKDIISKVMRGSSAFSTQHENKTESQQFLDLSFSNQIIKLYPEHVQSSIRNEVGDVNEFRHFLPLLEEMMVGEINITNNLYHNVSSCSEPDVFNEKDRTEARLASLENAYYMHFQSMIYDRLHRNSSLPERRQISAAEGIIEAVSKTLPSHLQLVYISILSGIIFRCINCVYLLMLKKSDVCESALFFSENFSQKKNRCRGDFVETLSKRLIEPLSHSEKNFVIKHIYFFVENILSYYNILMHDAMWKGNNTFEVLSQEQKLRRKAYKKTSCFLSRLGFLDQSEFK